MESLILDDLLPEPQGVTFGNADRGSFSGPSLARVEPIELVLNILDRAADEDLSDLYPLFFVNRLRVIAGSASVDRRGDDHDWGDSLSIGEVCDAQHDERRRRTDAMIDHLRTDPKRRTALIDWLNANGRFIDHRPHASPEAAVANVRAAGLLLEIDDGGTPKVSFPARQRWSDDQAKGWPMKRARDRFSYSVRRRGWAGEIIRLIAGDGG